MNNLLKKHGYYIVVDRNDDTGYFMAEFGKGYADSIGVSSISIKDENGFIQFYIDGIKSRIADSDLIVRSFTEIVDSYLEGMSKECTKDVFFKRDGENLIPYFEKV